MTQIPSEQFEARYRIDPDPWNFATSDYEQRRFDITVACLPPGRFRRAFEPACAGGELTVRLSARCDELVACDASPTVTQHATRRVTEGADAACLIEVATAAVPAWWPTGTFDLVVLSEIGYYFDPTRLQDVIRQTDESLRCGGTLLAVHWLGTSDDHLLSGDDVHRIIHDTTSLRHEGRLRDPGFRLDWWRSEP
jgi:hypothetical protein